MTLQGFTCGIRVFVPFWTNLSKHWCVAPSLVSCMGEYMYWLFRPFLPALSTPTCACTSAVPRCTLTLCASGQVCVKDSASVAGSIFGTSPWYFSHRLQCRYAHTHVFPWKPSVHFNKEWNTYTQIYYFALDSFFTLSIKSLVKKKKKKKDIIIRWDKVENFPRKS